MATNPADKFAQKTFSQLESQISRMYREAYKDVSQKMADFTRRHKAKDKQMQRDLKKGKITPEQYASWMRGQVFIGQQWQDAKASINMTVKNVMNEAASLTHSKSIDVFVDNANYTAYQMEKDLNGGINFTLYDRRSVSRLIREDPELLPRKVIDGKKADAWNTKIISNSVAQAIIQGESIDELSKRIARDTSIDAGRSSLLYARTAMTGAQNAGRVERMKEAEEMGIKVQKQWMSTLDSRTRDTHREMDGEIVDTDEEFSNGLEYPGDPAGDPREVYNCRCTLIYHYPEYSNYANMERTAYYEEGDPEYDPDHRNYETVRGMSYEQWTEYKQNQIRARYGGKVTEDDGQQNFEWNNNNSGGFEVEDGDIQSIVNKNMSWYDELYKSSGGFNSKEIQAIRTYQNSSQAINEQLRSGTLKPSTKTKINALTRVLDGSRVDSPFVAHRSSDGKLLGIDGEVSVEKLKSMVGQVVTDNGFTSTSLSKNTGYTRGSAQYVQKTGGIKKEELVQYHIKTPAGNGIGGLTLGSKWGGENGRYVGTPEFIFNRGSQFKVVGVYEKNGVVHCNLEYVGNVRNNVNIITKPSSAVPSEPIEVVQKRERIDRIMQSYTVTPMTTGQKTEFRKILEGMEGKHLELYEHMVEFHKDNNYIDGPGWYDPSIKKVEMTLNANRWEKVIGRKDSTGAWKTKFHEELHQLDHILGITQGNGPYSSATACVPSFRETPTDMGKRMKEAIHKDIISFFNKAIDKYVEDIHKVNPKFNLKHIEDLSKPIQREVRYAVFNLLSSDTVSTGNPERARALLSPLTDAIGLATGDRISPYSEGYWGHKPSYNKELKDNGATSECFAEIGSHIMRNDKEALEFLAGYMPESIKEYRGSLDEILEYVRQNVIHY